MDKIIHGRIVALEQEVEKLKKIVAELERQKSSSEEYEMEQSELRE